MPGVPCTSLLIYDVRVDITSFVITTYRTVHNIIMVLPTAIHILVKFLIFAGS
jgi:hypothetical protein